MRAEIVELLICPHCRGRLSQAGSTLQCVSGHTFDVARQGYVNLLPGKRRPPTGDTASMVRARETFLAGGHFSGLRDAIVETAARAVPGAPPKGGNAAEENRAGCIVEVGAGTGYYLSGVLDRLPDRFGLALDISKFALRRAARAHERLGAVACDTWYSLPVRNHCAELILDIFAPRNPSEFRRVLGPEGRLVLAHPGERHLCELVSALGLIAVDRRKEERLEDQFAQDFVLTGSVCRDEFLALTPTEITVLAEMGPSAFHIPAEEIARKVAMLPDVVTVTVSVNISVYRAAESFRAA